MQSPSAPGASAAPLVLLLTGDRHNDHVTIWVHGKPVQLTTAPLGVLIELILAGGNSGQGFVKLPSRDVYRLRQLIDDAVGPGAGKALIATGSCQEYRLTVPVDSQVGITKCFYELVPIRVVTESQANELRNLWVESSWDPREIGRGSP